MKKGYWIKSRNKHPRRNIISKKLKLQKQLFADFQQNKCSQKFCNIHRKTLVLESLLKKVAGFEVCKSIKRRLQHRCFPVNIAKFLRTAFSIEQLLWLLLELRHFFSPATLVSIHMRFPLNTFKGEGTSCGKLNVIGSLIWFLFFQIAISLLACCHFFRTTLFW